MMHHLFAVAGNPVLHSRSPGIFNAAFAALGIGATYTRIAATSAGEILEIAKEMPIEGLNITSPFKEAIANLVEIDEDAKKIGAVNTLVSNGSGGFLGRNTDWKGAVGALENSGTKIKNSNAVVLGAGGAASAAAYGLLKKGAEVTILNRTAEKAEKIARRLGCYGAGLGMAEKTLEGASIVVSCIPGAERVLEPRLLRKGMAVLDANYAHASALAKDARKAGCTAIDGREWLLHQAIPAFELFLGTKAPVEVMRKALYPADACKDIACKGIGKRASGNISLIGFMGSGKTSVAKEIGAMAGMETLETDHEIEKLAGKSVGQIFQADGETEFRKLEKKEIAKLANISNKVVSCGGGAVLDIDSRKALSNNSTVFWLFADACTILNRLGGASGRPLLLASDANERKMKAEKLMESRMPDYAKAADAIVDTRGKTPKQIAERICNETGIMDANTADGDSDDEKSGKDYDNEVIEVGSAQVEGEIAAPPSKSMMVRAVAASILSEGKSIISNPSFCDDGLAAIGIAKALGASVGEKNGKMIIAGAGNPASAKNAKKGRLILDCVESGLCIRMFSPISALRAEETALVASGTLAKRQIKQVEQLAEMGAKCATNNGYAPVLVKGPVHAGKIRADGSQSSQFITGLLMALPLCESDSEITIENPKSSPYLDMTVALLGKYGISISKRKWTNGKKTEISYSIRGNQKYKSCNYHVEGDWSGAAFMLVAGAIAGSVKLTGLDADSPQGDKRIMDALTAAGADVRIKDGSVETRAAKLRAFEFDATDCPDLFPPLAALACNCEGTSKVKGVNRLREKESDRASALAGEFAKMGAKIKIDGDCMEIYGKKLHGAEVDSHNDHRIAMACAVAGLNCNGIVKIRGWKCASKSYPGFFRDLEQVKKGMEKGAGMR